MYNIPPNDNTQCQYDDPETSKGRAAELETGRSRNDEFWSDPTEPRESLPPVAPFQESFLPAPLRHYALDRAERGGYPLDFIGSGLLVSFSSIIGAGCAIRPLRLGDWTVIPNLWGGVVGAPGARKSPSLNDAMAPLAALEHEADLRYEEEKRKSQIESIERDLRKKKLKDRLGEAIDDEHEQQIESGKAALLNLEKETRGPKWKRYRTSDCTTEKLEEVLADNPRGILLSRDELVGFLASLDREGREGARAFFLEGWNGYSASSFKTDRVGRGTTSCNPCISILGGITPAKLRQYLHGAVNDVSNDGFIQRFQLLTYPDLVKEPAIDRLPNIEARERLDCIATRLAKTSFLEMGAVIEGTFPIPVLRNNLEAQACLSEWLESHDKRVKDLGEGLIPEHLSKYNKLIPALAAISFLVRIAAGAQPGRIALEDVQRAIETGKYLETHARRIYSLAMQGAVYSAKTLLKKIKEGSLTDGFALREVYRNGWERLSQPEAREACEELIELGWLRREKLPPSPNGGPAAVKYRVHPKLRKCPE
jgi:hypothetical protein